MVDTIILEASGYDTKCNYTSGIFATDLALML
jgi:hypothetical protein